MTETRRETFTIKLSDDTPVVLNAFLTFAERNELETSPYASKNVELDTASGSGKTTVNAREALEIRYRTLCRLAVVSIGETTGADAVWAKLQALRMTDGNRIMAVAGNIAAGKTPEQAQQSQVPAGKEPEGPKE